MTIFPLSKSFILCFLLSPFGFRDSILASGQTIPKTDKFVHRGFGYFTNSWHVLQAATTNLDMCVYMCHVRTACYGLSYKSATSTCQLHAVSTDSVQFASALTVDSQYKLLVREMQQQETCPDSNWQYLPSSKKCYRFFNTNLQFNDAEKECNKYGYGGHLVQPSTDEEATLIAAISQSDNYLGIITLDTPTYAFYYLDGRLAVLPTIFKWWGGYDSITQPTPGKNCVLLGVQGGNRVWWDYVTWGDPKYYICELPVLHG